MDLEGSTFEGRTGVAMRRSRRAVSDVGVGITALDVSFSHLRPRREIIIGDAPDKLDVVEMVSGITHGVWDIVPSRGRD